MREDMDPVLRRAIEVAGGQTALAVALGVTQGAIAQWRRVPVLRVRDVESLTGISRYELRPDIYGFVPPAAADRVAQ